MDAMDEMDEHGLERADLDVHEPERTTWARWTNWTNMDAMDEMEETNLRGLTRARRNWHGRRGQFTTSADVPLELDRVEAVIVLDKTWTIVQNN